MVNIAARKRLRHMPPRSGGASGLTRVSVEQLYGRFNYPAIPIGQDHSENLTILFGNNGTGKSTILRLVYAILSPAQGEGLRNYLAKTPFRALSVTLSSGLEVRVRKLKGLTGAYAYEFLRGDAKTAYNVKTDSEGHVDRQESILKIEYELKSIGANILFIDHLRNIRSTYDVFSGLPYDAEEASDRIFEQRARHLREREVWASARNSSMIGNTDPTFPLEQIIYEVSQWFRVAALKQGHTGDQDASQVYLDVIKALARRRRSDTAVSFQAAPSILETLHQLHKTSDPYIKHGLLSAYPFAELAAFVESAPRDRLDEINAVMVPFLDSIYKRLEAFREIQTIISTFEREINRFFDDKVVEISVIKGLQLRLPETQVGADEHGVEAGAIDPRSLSSGEQQLVFLFCAALLSRDRPSLIMIDEPELSLNFKWQRKIVGSLLKIVSKSATQFLMASHSIEVISAHKSAAHELR